VDYSVGKKYTESILRMLLQGDEFVTAQFSDIEPIDWDFLLSLARDNRVVIRLYDSLLQHGIEPSESYRAYVADEKRRVALLVELMGQVAVAYESAGIDFVFIKNYQHYPDMGDDIDLLVLNGKDADSCIVSELALSPHNLSLLNKFGGKTQYCFHDGITFLEIHHDRLGRLGEHRLFPKIIVKNLQYVRLNGIVVPVPSAEDQFLLQVLQRVYTHFFFRISELLFGVNVVSSRDLDLGYLARISQEIGISPGLSFYLSIINSFYAGITQTNLPLDRPEFLDPKVADQIVFRDSHYRLPMFPWSARFFAQKWISDLRSLSWQSAARLSLAPAFAVLEGVEKINRRAHGAIDKGTNSK
jgi:hypothetical protein